jgi:hypothetical protein
MISVKVHQQKELIQLEMKARKSLDGNILIFDHHEIDIVIMPEKNKVVTFAKNDYSEAIYHVQDRFFEFLKRKGIVTYESVQGGNVYGSIEGLIVEAKDPDLNVLDYTIYNIYKFLKEEKPHYDYMQDYEEMLDDYYTAPTGEDSTELGEIPQATEKGSIRPGYNHSPYWMSYMLEEEKKK